MHGVNDRSAREALLDLMVLFPTVFLLIIGASQLSGLGIARWHLPAAMVLTMAAIFTLNRDNPKRATVRVCLIFLAIVTLYGTAGGALHRRLVRFQNLSWARGTRACRRLVALS